MVGKDNSITITLLYGGDYDGQCTVSCAAATGNGVERACRYCNSASGHVSFNGFILYQYATTTETTSTVTTATATTHTKFRVLSEGLDAVEKQLEDQIAGVVTVNDAQVRSCVWVYCVCGILVQRGERVNPMQVEHGVVSPLILMGLSFEGESPSERERDRVFRIALTYGQRQYVPARVCCGCESGFRPIG